MPLPTEVLVQRINEERTRKGIKQLFYDIEIPSICFICEYSPDKDGYPRLSFHNKRYRLIRLLWQLSFGEISPKMLIRHTCNNPKCINLNHLMIGTSKDNVNDMIESGNLCKGSNHPVSKLTENQIIKILKDRRTQKQIANSYGVSQQLISKIKTRKMWRYL